jgi:hypothetical protein
MFDGYTSKSDKIERFGRLSRTAEHSITHASLERAEAQREERHGRGALIECRTNIW